MGKEFLEKIRRLNWVLSESTTGKLSYDELSRILSEIINANIYIIDSKGFVMGGGYTEEEDKSTFEEEPGFEKITDSDNLGLMGISKTEANLMGRDLIPFFGKNYRMMDKYHTFVPSVCGGKRLGTILLAKYHKPFTDEEIALAEYGAAVVGLEIQRNDQLQLEHENNLKMAVDMAFYTMSHSEKDALGKILCEMEDDEGIIVASKIAAKYKLTNSVIVSALKKLESAGVLETKSLGMKGTYIKIVNPYIKERVQ